ncbi:MAG: DMT family transporter [Bryobacteraceae bacterium]|nr:DMT family transporter [Bryobacteraceae bacterium]
MQQEAATPAPPWSSRLMVVAAALLFSTGGAAIKSLTLTGWQTASLRSLVAGLVLFAVLPEARKGLSPGVVPAGCAYAATLVLFVLANKLTTSANAIFLQSTAPAFMLFLAPVILKERIGRREIIYSITLLAGMLLLFRGESSPAATAPDEVSGNWLALGSGFTYAITLIALRRGASRTGTAISVVAAGNLIAFAACAPMAFPIVRWQASDVWLILFLGLCQIGLAYGLLTRGMRRVPAFESATLLLAEPVMNPVVTWWALGERPSLWALGGGAVILVSTIVKTWLDRPGR